MSWPPRQTRGRRTRRPRTTLEHIKHLQASQATTAPISRWARKAQRQYPHSQAATDMKAGDLRRQEISAAIDDLHLLKDRLVKFKKYPAVVTWLFNRIRATNSYGMYSPIPDEAAALHCDCDPQQFEDGSAKRWIHSQHTLFNRAAWEIIRRRRNEILAAAEAKLAELGKEDEKRARLQALINFFLCAEEYDWLIGTYSGLGLLP